MSDIKIIMESWRKHLVEQGEGNTVTKSVNRDNLKSRFLSQIEKFKDRVPNIEAIVDRYVDMKLKDGSKDYSDFAAFVMTNREKSLEDETEALDDIDNFDPTDPASFRTDVKFNENLNEFFNIGQQIGSDLAGGASDDKMREIIKILSDHSDAMSKRVRFIDQQISKKRRVPEESPEPATSDDLEQLLKDRESVFQRVVNKMFPRLMKPKRRRR